jgi:aconitate hydratase 2/2-methylisocitrate dehydratase
VWAAQPKVDNATVVSTSTRNFPNRLGDNADVYLSSAEVAAIAAVNFIPVIFGKN